MKEIIIKEGTVIKTPWLNVDEAAAHCGLPRSVFMNHAERLPHGGTPEKRLYNVRMLDTWMENELDTPFPRRDDSN